jgi:hypothetical protein
MLWNDFSHLIAQQRTPVILLAGRRNLPERDQANLTALGERLARAFPQATFRTGNAAGADSAFAAGVAKVDPARLELVVPRQGHRRGNQAALGGRAFALEALAAVAQEDLARVVVSASPAYAILMRDRVRVPRLQAQANYLLRDTLMVVGAAGLLAPASVGIFYADAADPMKGGTGHTIRACRANTIPALLQRHWMPWLSAVPERAA